MSLINPAILWGLWPRLDSDHSAFSAAVQAEEVPVPRSPPGPGAPAEQHSPLAAQAVLAAAVADGRLGPVGGGHCPTDASRGELPSQRHRVADRRGHRRGWIWPSIPGSYVPGDRTGYPNHVFMYRRTLLRGGTGLVVFALLLLAVALPYGHRIKAEISSPLPSVAQNLPVAAVFLFDTSLSMSYRQRNFTRLEAAQQIAAEHLGRLPTSSRVAIADTSNEQPLVFQAEQSVRWTGSRSCSRARSACRLPTAFERRSRCRTKTCAARSPGRNPSPRSDAPIGFCAKSTSSPT